MFYIIFVLIIGISFAPLLFPKMHFYLAQGMWAQCCIALMLFCSLIENRKRVVKNCPVAMLFLWITVLAGWVCYRAQANNSHQIFYFFHYFNFLCGVIFYKLAHEYLTYEHVKTILRWMKYVVYVTLFVSVLQIFGLSQFFGLLFKNDPYHNNLVSGFIGNGAHLSGFLAICLPLLLIDGRRQDWLAIVLLFLVLLFCGTNINDISATGFVVSGIVFLNIFKNKKLAWLLLFAVGLLAFFILPEQFFSFNGRVESWQQAWEMIQQRPVTGQGLGATEVIRRNTGLINTPHLHNVVIQMWLEMGLIGIVLITYFIKDCFDRVATSRLQLCLKSSLLAFVCVSLLLFPTHLWLESMWGLFLYVAFLIVHKEESKMFNQRT